MSEAACKALLDHFAGLNDRRQAAKVLYPLPEILLLLLSATLAGANDSVEMEFWGREQLPFLRRFLPYRQGVPSHDTLNGALAALDPTLFKACFVSWVEGLREAEPDLVAIDGKTSRRSHARGKGREPLHLVSAWARRSKWRKSRVSWTLAAEGMAPAAGRRWRRRQTGWTAPLGIDVP